MKLPNANKHELAEFVGCMIGDGHIGIRNNEISITGDKNLDLGHFYYICKICKRLFGIIPKIYVHKRANIIKIKFYSKKSKMFFKQAWVTMREKIIE